MLLCLKIKKSECFKNKINNNINNPKKLWQNLKQLTNTKSRSMLLEIEFVIDNELITVSGDNQKVEMFN